jgi:hypothetical protein
LKVLCFYTTKFAYTPGDRTMDEVIEVPLSAGFEDCVVAFIQTEESDELQDLKSREKKLVNHLKWVARKNNCQSVILHSFAHLSSSKASIGFTRQLFDAAQTRLENGNYLVNQTPFGYFLNLEMSAPGFSMARTWAEL